MASDELSATPETIVVDSESDGMRLDAFLASRFPQYSRVHLRRVINAAAVQVDGKRKKAAYRVTAAQSVTIVLPEIPREGPQPEELPLDLLFEDEHLIAVNKAAGMVVHPAKGHWAGTLTSALAFHFESLSSVGGPTRPGIVHRLDRETSGVMVVAKTDQAHHKMAAQFEHRTVKKEYLAIVLGRPDRDRDMIDQPIGAHPYSREKKAIRADHSTSREARTFYEVSERFDGFTLLQILPQTGRTHQIRVHLTHLGYPVLCDRLYGGRSQITRGELSAKKTDKPTDLDQEVVLKRQALHAQCLSIQHPITGEPISFSAPLPADLQTVLDILRQS
jgi:23S rRNA pseudouridine1911/1915/1917 synthase